MTTIAMEGLGSFLTLSAGLMICVGVLAYRMFPRQPLQALLSFVTLLFMVISVLQLLLGGLQVLNPIALLSSGIAFIIGVTGYLWKRSSTQDRSKDQPHAIATLSYFGWAMMLGISVLACGGIGPLRSVLYGGWMQMRSVHVLDWDVVSYHLPNAVRYLQAQTWWMIQGSGGHQFGGNEFGGNELINLWSLIPLKSEAMLGLTTGALFWGSLLGMVIIFNLVVPLRSPIWRGVASLSFLFGLLSIPEFNALWLKVANPDVAVLFWETIVLWSFLRSKTRTKNWALITGIALGLLMGTRANGLYFLLGTVIFNLIIPNSELRESWRDRRRSTLSQIFLPSLLLGGIWSVRNLAQAAPIAIHLNPLWFNPARFSGFNLSDRSTAILITSLMSSALVLGWRYWQSVRATDSPFPGISTRLTIPLGIQIIAGWNLLASLVFIFVPSQSRLPMATGKPDLISIQSQAIVLPLTGILLLYGLSLLLEKALQPQAWMNALEKRQIASPSQLPIAIAGSIIFCLSIAQLSTYRTPAGLPGHQGLSFESFISPNSAFNATPQSDVQPGTQQGSANNVYEWVQQNLKNATIYSVGLRPYGLFGDELSNVVIDRLSASGWTQEEAEQVIKSRTPQYLTVCLDPFDRTAPPGIQALLTQRDRFEIVYRDAIAIVFRIRY